MNCVYQLHGVRDVVEGQSSGRMIQVHADPRGRLGKIQRLVIVTEGIFGIEAPQTPGLIVTPEIRPAAATALPVDAFISHRNGGVNSEVLFDLPVMASAQTLFTEDLLRFVETLRMRRIVLDLMADRYLSVVVRQTQLPVRRVPI